MGMRVVSVFSFDSWQETKWVCFSKGWNIPLRQHHTISISFSLTRTHARTHVIPVLTAFPSCCPLGSSSLSFLLSGRSVQSHYCYKSLWGLFFDEVFIAKYYSGLKLGSIIMGQTFHRCAFGLVVEIHSRFWAQVEIQVTVCNTSVLQHSFMKAYSCTYIIDVTIGKGNILNMSPSFIIGG